jgi:hypothetical protein
MPLHSPVPYHAANPKKAKIVQGLEAAQRTAKDSAVPPSRVSIQDALRQQQQQQQRRRRESWQGFAAEGLRAGSGEESVGDSSRQTDTSNATADGGNAPEATAEAMVTTPAETPAQVNATARGPCYGAALCVARVRWCWGSCIL